MAWIDCHHSYRQSESNIKETENKIAHADKHSSGDTLIQNIAFWKGTLKLQQSTHDYLAHQHRILTILTVIFLFAGLISGIPIRFRLPDFTSVFTSVYLLISCFTVLFFMMRQNAPEEIRLNMAITGPLILLWTMEAFMISYAWRFRQKPRSQIYLIASFVLGMILLLTALFIFSMMHLLETIHLT
jgi:RsiW-degrading membrane proteinase PrsW (M82 family)